MDMTGAVLKERYCIIGQAGAGASGTLYLAKDLELSSIWAVKRISPEKKREARLLARLSHPHIPRMIDYAEQEDACFLVMEYIQGTSLDKLVGGRRLSYAQLLRCAWETAETLFYLHTREPSLCYADLKPANLILSREGRLYLVDFGSAAPSTGGQRGGTCEGTPQFAAPEQYEGILTPASDVYGLGKTMRALAGRRLMLAHPGLFLLIQACTRKDREKRLSDCEAVLRRLKVLRRLRFIMPGMGAAVLLAVFCLLFGLPGGAGRAVFREEAASDQQEETQEDEELFWKKLTGITEVYWELAEKPAAQKEYVLGELRHTEAELKALLTDFSSSELQDRVLELLQVQRKLEESWSQ